MNGTGLAITLIVAVIVGVLFAVYPRLDIAIAALFFEHQPPHFDINVQVWVQNSRNAARVLIGLLVVPAAVAFLGKVIMPNRRMLIPGRAAMFLGLTLVLGPGLIANVLLKDHWGRTRPIDLTEFGGTGRFTPWWDPRGDCPDNCSFVAGEPSGAFWTLAPAALAPPQWRVLAYGAALAFGAAIGVLRVAAGAHFFTDVVFAFVIMFLVVWAVHGLLYRWGAAGRTKTTDKSPPS
jgi:lipid A 4'-phosphatase